MHMHSLNRSRFSRSLTRTSATLMLLSLCGSLLAQERRAGVLRLPLARPGRVRPAMRVIAPKVHANEADAIGAAGCFLDWRIS